MPLYHIPDESLPPRYEYLKIPDCGLSSSENITENVETLSSPNATSPCEAIAPTTVCSTGGSQHSHKQCPLEILVVDDSQSNRKLLAHLLSRQGHHCTQACDGVEAVNIVRERIMAQTKRAAVSNSDDDCDQDLHDAATLAAAEEGRLSSAILVDKKHDQGEQLMFDCILLDYEMPNLNGPGAAKQMRQLGCRSYILGVTGNVLQEDVRLFENSGADGVLAKPVKLPVLKEMWRANGVGVRSNVLPSSLSSLGTAKLARNNEEHDHCSHTPMHSVAA